MLYDVGLLLPEYRVKASNDSVDPAEANNRIHDNEYARRCGFRAGLVSGLSIFAYMSRSLTELLGREWLDHGSAEVRFVRPVYEGEEIRVSGSVTSAPKDGPLLLEYQASNNQGAVCGIGTAKQTAAPDPEPSIADYPPGKTRIHRPISLESIKKGEALTPVTSEFTWNIHWQYCQKSVRDHHPVYQKAMHPGWLVNRASRILSVNYAVPAWIDVSTHVQNFHRLEEECSVETRGRIQDKFERNGDHFIVMDLAVFTPHHCLATIRHTAIFRIAPNAA
jgi:hypothetical protein